MSRTRGGFSLLEMLLVIALLALILGMLFINSGTSQANRQVDAAAQELEGALILTHSTAINKQGANITITPPAAGEGSYLVMGNVTQAAEKSGKLPVGVLVTVSPSGPVIQFSPSGSIPAATTINCTSSRTGRSYTITVAKLTGAVLSNLTHN